MESPRRFLEERLLLWREGGVGGGCTYCFLKSTKGPTGELEVWSLEPGEEVYIGGLAVCQWPGFYKVLYMRGR